MSNQSGSRRSGIASFVDDDEVPVPTPEQIAMARTGGEGLGFRTDKAPPAPVPAPARAPVAASTKVKPPALTGVIQVRVRPEDRDRFDEFAYRHRLSKGDAMKLLLDRAEAIDAEERDRSQVSE